MNEMKISEGTEKPENKKVLVFNERWKKEKKIGDNHSHLCHCMTYLQQLYVVVWKMKLLQCVQSQKQTSCKSHS